jgi:hypothetical protein
VAGALTLNYAVAWACVLWSSNTLSLGSSAAFKDLEGRQALVPNRVIMTKSLGFQELSCPISAQIEIPPEVAGRAGATRNEFSWFRLTAAGLPFSCLRYTTHELPARWVYAPATDDMAVAPGNDPSSLLMLARNTTLNTDKLTSRGALRIKPNRDIPWKPMWPTFLLNTLCYAALLAAPYYLNPTLKRRRRQARGQCISCGYELQGLPKCPECNRPAAAPAAPSARLSTAGPSPLPDLLFAICHLRFEARP